MLSPDRCSRFRGRGLLALAFALAAVAGQFCLADGEPALSREQIEHFLLTAKVIKSQQSGKGITNPWRLTLTDGALTHDASFQAVDEHATEKTFSDGHMELLFVDSYKYNIAAYRLAELLGVDDLLPVYVERKWRGQAGSLSWWLPVQMDEANRIRRKVQAPDAETWNRQMYKIRVFDELVYDTDPNLTNVLIGNDWKIYRVDFTRAFRLSKNLKNPGDLVRCDRKLLDRLKALDASELAESTRRYLNKEEVKAVLARRDKIVAYFQQLIVAKGENEVLY